MDGSVEIPTGADLPLKTVHFISRGGALFHRQGASEYRFMSFETGLRPL
jgi:hypothetical protein